MENEEEKTGGWEKIGCPLYINNINFLTTVLTGGGIGLDHLFAVRALDEALVFFSRCQVLPFFHENDIENGQRTEKEAVEKPFKERMSFAVGDDCGNQSQ